MTLLTEHAYQYIYLQRKGNLYTVNIYTQAEEQARKDGRLEEHGVLFRGGEVVPLDRFERKEEERYGGDK